MELKNNKINVVSPAKINLHLEVLGRRKDGYHELAMLMQSINLEDYLEFEINDAGDINLSSNNTELDLKEDNLIVKAANILKNNISREVIKGYSFIQMNIILSRKANEKKIHELQANQKFF